MPDTPLMHLYQLNQLTLQLDEVQEVIDIAVDFAKKTNAPEEFYHALYAKQQEVDKKRALVEALKVHHASCN